MMSLYIITVSKTYVPNKMLEKALLGLFQHAEQKAWFLLGSIFQAHKPCLKNGGASMRRTQAVFQQPANELRVLRHGRGLL
jgi:hypothetical protein